MWESRTLFSGRVGVEKGEDGDEFSNGLIRCFRLFVGDTERLSELSSKDVIDSSVPSSVRKYSSTRSAPSSVGVCVDGVAGAPTNQVSNRALQAAAKLLTISY